MELLPDRFLDLAPREYVILGKLQFFKEGGGERHIRDIRAMLELDDSAIDRAVLDPWIKRLHLQSEWELILGD